MPSFNLTMVVQFVEMMNVFLVAPILTVVAGIPAFLVAASPAPSRRPSNLAMGCSAGVLLAIGLFARGLDVRAIVVAIACGVLVGAATRRVRVVRRYWPLFGIAGTVSIAVVTFALGHYNARYYTCWP
ncbi:MAG TPA: hypothetical protein VFB22_01515 [Candidatus Baltobacteraceae bacterium]|nr:hypothetical protein [Candidatus Baltobacteraceae bacterium]